jgi:hypothetical protein
MGRQSKNKKLRQTIGIVAEGTNTEESKKVITYLTQSTSEPQITQITQITQIKPIAAPRFTQ